MDEPRHHITSRNAMKMEKIDWPREKTIDFIEEYRKLTSLWDARQEQYKDGQAKLEAQMKLAELFDCDLTTVKKKIKNLRTAFRRECRKERSKWFAFDQLTFLEDVDPSRVSFDFDAEMPLSDDEEDSENHREENRGVYSASNLATASIKTEALDDSTTITRWKRKPNDETVQADGEDAPSSSSVAKRLRRDPHTVFGEHVANEIRGLDSKSRTIAKHMINNILFDAAMGKYQNDPFEHYTTGRTSPYCNDSMTTFKFVTAEDGSGDVSD